MKNPRLLLVLVVVLFAASGAGLFLLNQSREAEHRQVVQTQQQLTSAQTELANVQKQISDLTAEKKKSEDDLNAKIESLNAAAREYDANIKSQADRISQMTQTNEALKKDKDAEAAQIQTL